MRRRRGLAALWPRPTTWLLLATMAITVIGAFSVPRMGGNALVGLGIAAVGIAALTRQNLESAAVGLLLAGWATSAFISDSTLAERVASVSGDVSLSPSKLLPLVLVAGGTGLSLLLPSKRQLPGRTVAQLLGVYMAFLLIGSLLNPDPQFPLMRWVQTSVPVFGALAYMRLGRPASHFVAAAVGPTVVHVILGFITGLGANPGGRANARFSGYLHPVIMSFEAAVVLVLAGWLLFHRRRPGWAAVLGFLAAFALIASRGRTGFSAAIVGIGAVLVTRDQKEGDGPADTTTGLRLTVAASMVMGYLTVQSSALASWFERGQSADSLLRFSGRVPIWENAIRFWTERPLTGWGAGVFRAGEKALALNAAAGRTGDRAVGHAHNAFLEALATSGIVGALSWLAAVIVSGRRLATRTGAHRTLVLPLLLSVCVAGVTEGQAAAFGVMWYVLLACIAAAHLPWTAAEEAVEAPGSASVGDAAPSNLALMAGTRGRGPNGRRR